MEPKTQINVPPPQHMSTNEDEEEQEPLYVKLYEKTKSHKDGHWDMDAEVNYHALKNRHADEIEQHGMDNLTVQEAYIDVLKTQPGYIRGLGPGSQPPKKGCCGEESSTLRSQLASQIQEFQQASKEREVTLQEEIKDLKATNDELKTRMEQEALEREDKMRQEIHENVKDNAINRYSDIMLGRLGVS